MISKRLKAARKEAGYSQEQIAEILNTSRSNISKYENGKLEPSMQTLKQLCIIYRVSADYILGIEIKPENIKYNIHSHDKSVQNIKIKE